jgi:hypothetical protein
LNAEGRNNLPDRYVPWKRAQQKKLTDMTQIIKAARYTPANLHHQSFKMFRSCKLPLLHPHPC